LFQITLIIIIVAAIFAFDALEKRAKKSRKLGLDKVINENILKARKAMSGTNFSPESGLKVSVLVILVIVVAILAMMSTTVVGVGERGVKDTFGRVSPKVLTEGLHFKIPFVQTIKKYDVKTVRTEIRTEAYTKDIQTSHITYILNYNLQPDYAAKMALQVGPDYESIVIRPTVEGSVKDTIGKWNADALVNNCELAAKEIFDMVGKSLKAQGIIVSGFNIVDIKYASEFERAIEAKVKAQQEALQAKNKTVQVEEEAKQKLVSAKAEAESMRIRANALTQNKSLVQYEAVQKWDGKMPYYMMGNAVPFINVGGGQ